MCFIRQIFFYQKNIRFYNKSVLFDRVPKSAPVITTEKEINLEQYYVIQYLSEVQKYWLPFHNRPKVSVCKRGFTTQTFNQRSSFSQLIWITRNDSTKTVSKIARTTNGQ